MKILQRSYDNLCEGTVVPVDWVPGAKDLEELNLYCTRGAISKNTHPELFRQCSCSFPPVPRDRFPTQVPREFLPPQRAARSAPTHSYSSSQRTSIGDLRILTYNPNSLPAFQNGSVRRTQIDAFRRRYESFDRSELLRKSFVAYQLAHLSFYYVGERNPVKLRCARCFRTVPMFLTEDGDSDRRISNLLQFHAHHSATCPSSIGLIADDRPFSANYIASARDHFVRTGAIEVSSPNLSNTSHRTCSSVHDSALTVLSNSPDCLPALDDDNYFSIRSENDYEMLSQFDSDPNFELNSYSEELTPSLTSIDFLIGEPPKHRDMCPIFQRIDSFENPEWRALRISQSLAAESCARAGFYYVGSGDKLRCHWCGLELNSWKSTDNPIHRHIISSPRCTWLYRLLGRHGVKNIYLNEMQQRQQRPFVSLIFLANSNGEFLHEIDDISGMDL